MPAPLVRPGLAGTHPTVDPMLAAMSAFSPPPDPDALERLLAGSVLLGAEIDLKFRVLSATVEPAANDHPLGDVEDTRLQLLCHPVSTILGVLERDVDGTPHIETFETEQLTDVAAAFAGCRLQEPVLGRPEPRPGQWGPQFSIQGRSTAPDGRLRTVTLEVAADDARLRLFVRCDEVEVRDPSGRDVAVS
jgi:hypothetical protein